MAIAWGGSTWRREGGSHENGIVNSFIYSRMEKIKTKVRFTSLDVAAMVQNLQRLIGMR